MVPAEDLDDTHRPATAGAWFPQAERDDLSIWRMIPFNRFRSEQSADLRDIGFAACAGQKAVMADVVEAVGQDMAQKAADELAGAPPDPEEDQIARPMQREQPRDEQGRD